MTTIDLLTLPPTAQQELLDFYQFLIEKNQVSKPLTENKTDFKTFLMNIPKADIDFERE
ncbi:MAG: DUF2281 domain-containing protein [Methylococcaceae bacterium]